MKRTLKGVWKRMFRSSLPLLAVGTLALVAVHARGDDILLDPPSSQPVEEDQDAAPARPILAHPPVTPPGYLPPAPASGSPVPATVPATGAAALPSGDDFNAVQQVLRQMEQEAGQNPHDPAYQQAISELQQLEEQLREQGSEASQEQGSDTRQGQESNAGSPSPFPDAAP